MTVRIFVGYGMGWFITSAGIAVLADKLKPYGTSACTAGQDFGNQAVAYINNGPPAARVVCVGYSLSASMLDWISLQAERKPALGIAIDPNLAVCDCAQRPQDRRLRTSRPQLPKTGVLLEPRRPPRGWREVCRRQCRAACHQRAPHVLAGEPLRMGCH